MIYKGTTPTYTITFTDEDLDLTDATQILLTIGNPKGNPIIEISDGLEIAEKAVSFSLTQEQTLAMPAGSLPVQLNWTYTYGGQTKRACSNILHINFSENLHKQVMS